MMRTADVAALRVKPLEQLRHGQEGVRQLAEDIKVNGIRNPIQLEERDGILILANGNHRLAAAELLGLDEVPVRIV